MKIAICDDEKSICLFMKKRIEYFYFDQEEDVTVCCFENGEKLLQTDLNEIDILFLDMEMPGDNGLEIAKKIRKENHDMIIIFVTAHEKFVFESFKVKAFRYLVKPIKDYDLVETLQSIHKESCDTDSEIFFRFQNENYCIKTEDIIYIEGMRGKIWIYCKNDTYRYCATLKHLNKTLTDKGFFQIHQSFIINMSKITRYDKNQIELERGHIVPISRYKWKEFQKEYARYWSKIL